MPLPRQTLTESSQASHGYGALRSHSALTHPGDEAGITVRDRRSMHDCSCRPRRYCRPAQVSAWAVPTARAYTTRRMDAADAIELAELLEFLGDWLESDRANLTTSLARFVGSQDYGPDALRGDFARFRFLLGVTDGEGVFTPDQP